MRNLNPHNPGQQRGRYALRLLPPATALLTLVIALLAVPAQARELKPSDYKDFFMPPTVHVDEAAKPAEVGDSATITAASAFSMGSLSSDPTTLSTPTYPNDTLVCNSWGYIAGKQNSYVTGNCGPGWEFDRRQKTGSPICNSSGACYYWYGGYITGDFQGCGWIRDVDVNQNSQQTHTGCAPGSIDKEPCQFIYCSDGTYNSAIVFGSSDDGQTATLKASCYMVANIRPWLNGQHIGGNITGRDAAGNPFNPQQDLTRFKARYAAKYTVDGYAFLMVHNTQPIAGQPSWAFMPWSCF